VIRVVILKFLSSQKSRIWLVYSGFIFFALLFILGLNSGEYRTILEKATKICLSCIGLG
jgi:predicted membrane-bound dolichyl-phosphate-mannose-protein mannosyltransferase